MNKSTPSAKLGMNRTGMQMAPLHGSSMMDYATDMGRETPRDHGEFEQVHRTYVEEADTVGSVPMPGTFSGMVQAGSAKLMGMRPESLVDKLGERLAFERGGTRLYDAMIMKITTLQGKGDGLGSTGKGSTLASRDNPDTDAYEALDKDGMQARSSRVDLASLQRIRMEEQAHMTLVKEALEELGADPTAMTPCADVVGVTSMGLIQTISDPRTTVAQSLNALLSAELADHAGWELLMEVAEALGHDEMAVRFSVAANTEAEHMALVKEWLRTELMNEAR
jgi:hypothetical protein